MDKPLKVNKKERIPSPLSEVSDHEHNGRGSKMLNTANFIAVLPDPPTWTGREGEIAFQATGTGPVYSMWVWLGGGWREFPYTP